MNRDLLERIGTALYGERWKDPLARDLKVNGRTVRRWLSGDWPVPGRLGAELLPLIERRGDELNGLATELAGENGGKA